MTQKLGFRVIFTENVMARAVGIEPTLEVLETPVLPLYDARYQSRKIINNFQQILQNELVDVNKKDKSLEHFH
jgi:hypothetical protein